MRALPRAVIVLLLVAVFAGTADPWSGRCGAAVAAPTPGGNAGSPGFAGTEATVGASAAPQDRVTESAASTSAGSQAGYGLFEDLQYLSPSALAARLDEFTALGVTWARFQLLWSNVQSQDSGHYDWAPYDRLVDALRARNITPLAVIGTSPPWARVSGCALPTCAPASVKAFATFAGQAAARYKPKGIHAWEVWNEPNTRTFWAPAPSASLYASLLIGTYAAIKNADPSASVVTGGLAPAETCRDASGVVNVAPVDFLAGVYKAGAGGSFDAVGWHPYTYPASPDSKYPTSAWYQMFGTTTSARSLMARYGDQDKQIWVTEFGAHTDPMGEGYLSEQQQAQTLSRGVALWKTYSWAGPFIAYQYQDRGTDERDRENFFGLTRANGSRKPAYAAFRSAITEPS